MRQKTGWEIGRERGSNYPLHNTEPLIPPALRQARVSPKSACVC